MNASSKSKPLPAFGGPLTAREIEVLQLVAECKTNPEIAAVLFLSENTVKEHLARIAAKLGASGRSSRAALVREAFVRGLAFPPDEVVLAHAREIWLRRQSRQGAA